MNETLLLAIGAVLFAMTTGATVFFGGAVLTRKSQQEDDGARRRADALARLARLDDDELERLAALREDDEIERLSELELADQPGDLEQPAYRAARGPDH